MNRTCLIRWLRIAVTVVCSLVCIGLIGLLVRSYWRADTVYNTDIALVSAQGCILFVYEQHTPHPYRNWGVVNQPISIWRNDHGPDPRGKFGFNFAHIPKGWLIATPTWLLVILIGSIAAVPWIRWSWRFSLRTMLIVTTLVAMALGFIVWMAK
jgi:hypothetical protein